MALIADRPSTRSSSRAPAPLYSISYSESRSSFVAASYHIATTSTGRRPHADRAADLRGNRNQPDPACRKPSPRVRWTSVNSGSRGAVTVAVRWHLFLNASGELGEFTFACGETEAPAFRDVRVPRGCERGGWLGEQTWRLPLFGIGLSFVAAGVANGKYPPAR